MSSSRSTSSFPPPPAASLRLGALFKLRPAGPRWPIATRAAITTGGIVAAGWATSDMAAALMACIGGFTALYGNDRPYLNRAGHVALVALSFALVVTFGVWSHRMPLAVVPAITLIAVLATFLCNALRVGPPGAYMFALACAVGTAMPADHLEPWQVGLLVFGGGAFAWLVHMTGAIIAPRNPERRAVRRAADAVARLAGALGTAAQDDARHNASLALHEAWTTLVTFQPARPRPDGTLSRLRAINRRLHLLFAKALTPGDEDPAAIAAEARQLGKAAARPGKDAERTDPAHVPLGHHGVLDAFRENFRPWSPAMLAAARVGVASVAAGAIGAALDLERAYWTMAAAVLILHQGLDWTRSLQRGIERMSGTFVGLFLAGIVLALHPEGLWLVATLMALQFTIEMVVVRNYALAVVFITCAALTISTGGHEVADVGHLLWVRGVDTVIGCTVGLAVHLLSAARALAVPIPREIAQTLASVESTLGHLASADMTSDAARRARRDLRHRAIMLLNAYDRSVGATQHNRRVAERLWPSVIATERLAYRVLAACWTVEQATNAKEAAAQAHALIDDTGLAASKRALRSIALAVQLDARPDDLPKLPAFLRVEIANLKDSVIEAERPDQGNQEGQQ
ncbi:FUSC family protein [Mesorhizobium xinjiangense]|uniref:FUSC family protein n=1 Tax=Mesorhizobium xinjiangense TaxID=2678685 RepID=UPI0012ED53F3|nr:FUSC family protein [Mesorhizobium xinjiangense]